MHLGSFNFHTIHAGLRVKEGRYEDALPWQEGHFELPSHYSLSLTRLRYLQHRLIKNPELLNEYDRII